MQDFGTKANDTAGPSGQLSAEEFNNLATELENSVLNSGVALSGASVTQLAGALFINGVKADGFQDSGVANAYVATPISGASGVVLPSSYAPLNGATISFVAAATNSGASTLNVGQTTGTLLGTKEIRTQSDVAIPGNAIVAGQHIQVRFNSAFNAGAGAWVLLPWAFSDLAAHGIAVFTSNGTWTVPAGVIQAFVIVIGGGGGGGRLATNPGPSGGGGGGVAEKLVSLVGVPTVAVTVGAGGIGGTTDGIAGTAGGSSSFAAFCSATGGGGGLVNGSTASGGTGTGGDVNYSIGDSSPAVLSPSSAVYGGLGGGAVSPIAATGTSTPGRPGCGGAGRTTSAAPNGANGIVIIRW